MPEEPLPKSRPHPLRAPSIESHYRNERGYVELAVTSNFTFLTGGSHPDELVIEAARLGHCAAAITDRNSLAGMVRAHVAAKTLGIQLLVGCRIELSEPTGISFLVFPTDRDAYAKLCTLLTLGKRRAAKGQCDLSLHDLIEFQMGLLAVAIPPRVLDEQYIQILQGMKRVFDDDRLSLAMRKGYHQDDAVRMRQVADLGGHVGVPIVATNDVHYHTPARRPLQDVLTCIRLGKTIDHAGFDLFQNAERHLKPADEMIHLFRAYPLAIARTRHIAERAKGFSLDQLRYCYPDEVVPEGTTAMEHLVSLTWKGAAWRYPGGLPDKVKAQVEHELRLIDELEYAHYFLTVHDIAAFAVSQGILCQGRGAAANSAVCYCLGVTAVDPDRVNVLFERFISKEREEPPDIDIDFEHERREEVIQYIYKKYGRRRAALTAEVISYRGKMAIRDVGKAMGLSLDLVDRLAKELSWWDGTDALEGRLKEMGLNPNDPRLRRSLALAGELVGFPRHLSQHVGGFVITKAPLCEMVPIENAAMPQRTVIEWDKDDIDALGMLKVDVLGLGMLTCLRKCMDLVAASDGERFTLATIPAEDSQTYDMICKADTVGVFQIESRAQMSMLPRLKPRCYYDLVIEVAIVRPGPIQGDMVHPYLRRRSGDQPITYASPEIERVLGRTLGVPLFQEQAMSLAIVAAGFTPGEADQLRRSIAGWKRKTNEIRKFQARLIDGMLERGHTRQFAEQVFTQISGFAGYGFPESHAASFALLVYASCWLKRHKPAAFAAALINSQPMGFYQPAQLVRDAAAHGVTVLPIDVNISQWDCTLEGRSGGQPGSQPAQWGKDGPALRLGMCLVKGLSEVDANRIADSVRKHGKMESIARLRRLSQASTTGLRRLAAADAFTSMGLTRQTALWSIRAMNDDPMPLFDGIDPAYEPPPVALPKIKPGRLVLQDYGSTGLSLKAHPLSFIRSQLSHMKVTTAAELQSEQRCPQGRILRVAGIVLVRQRPGTASGVVFITLEDETGSANLILWSDVFERFRRVARHSRVIMASGHIERRGDVVHLHVRQLESLDELIPALDQASRDFH